MSTIKVNKIENTSTTNGGVSIDNDGHVTIDGQNFPTAGPLSNRNLIINGAMMVDQRNSGALASPTGAYGFQLDRYAVWYSTGSGHTVQQVEDAPTNFQYSWKFTTGTGATPTGGDYGRLYYSVEGYDANVLELGTANQQAFTLSFYVKISVAGTYGVQFTDSLATTKLQSSFNIAAGEVGTWVRRVITVPARLMVNGTYSTSNGVSFAIAFDLGEGPTRSVAAGYYFPAASGGALGLTGGTKIMATSGATYQLTGIQLEVGTKATPFEHRSYSDELAKCQRYFQQLSTNTMFPGTTNGTTQVTHVGVPLAVTMRATPTVSPAVYTVWHGTAGAIVSTNQVMIITDFSDNVVTHRGVVNGFTGLTDNRVANILTQSVLQLSAEL